MLNQIVIVGRLYENLDGNELVIVVPRTAKNNDKKLEDIIKCNVWGNLADNVKEYCKKGDLIGIKGRIENNNDEIMIVAEKITFLSNSKEEK